MAVTLNYIGITTSDMARSLAFYRRLGLDIPAEADSQPHVEVVLGGGMKLAWDTDEVVHAFDPDWRGDGAAGRVGLAFACGSPDEVDAVYADLTRAGYTGLLKPWNAEWGQRYAVVRDPDNNSVDLYAPLTEG
ncbi:VOC family protein [Thermobifida halotolerans]|uniref:VOC family protein n=1 Tax=Thermobifida halotolerans TaxID=483545 RepID=A0AA97LVA9_9ACTN|nr:VOC family protein [Thermobifida halotolerans]UOE18787.1 VOC family protein [Thermobifida halotolerans]